MIRPCPLRSVGDERIAQRLAELDQQGGSIVLSPKDSAQVQLALIMSIERANDVELEEMVRAAYQLLHRWATTPPASGNGTLK